MSDTDKLREFVRLAGSATAVEKLALDLADENAVLKDEIRRHEEVFQFSANKIAALKRGIVEYAAMKQYLRAGPDGSTKPMWHDVDEEEKERYRESVRDVLLTAEEQDDE